MKKGVLSVAVHSFDDVKKGKRYYAAVTFRRDKVDPLKLKETMKVFERISNEKTKVITEK